MSWRNSTEGFPSSQCFRVNALDDVVFKGCVEEVVHATILFILHKNAAFYTRTLEHSALTLLNKVRKMYDLHESKLVGTWDSFLVTLPARLTWIT